MSPTATTEAPAVLTWRDNVQAAWEAARARGAGMTPPLRLRLWADLSESERRWLCRRAGLLVAENRKGGRPDQSSAPATCNLFGANSPSGNKLDATFAESICAGWMKVQAESARLAAEKAGAEEAAKADNLQPLDQPTTDLLTTDDPTPETPDNG